MKIAVIGSGISGLVSAWQLSKKYQVTLFEKNAELGGHTATKDIDFNGKQYAIDTGFIVFNDWTYPNFNRFLDLLDVEHQPTTMSFSVKNTASGLEYNGHTLSTLFAQKRNWLNPKFYCFLAEIIKFNKLSKKLLAGQIDNSGSVLDLSLGEFLAEFKFSDYFKQNYILAMGAAIWSSGLEEMKAFPLRFFLRFFNNHGLLNISHRPQWSVVKGGSKQYIQALLKEMQTVDIQLNANIQTVRRTRDTVEIITDGQVQTFDKLVFACHSDHALQLLDTPTTDETQVLGNIPYSNNQVILHTDSSLLPKRKAAWAAWNYYLSEQNPDTATLTYNMNILQGIQSETTFCVTLNQTEEIDPDKILGHYQYSHPVFNLTSFKAQKQRDTINGHNNTYYCGAYWYNGFHEDGIKSALDVCKMLDVDDFYEGK